MSPHRRPKGLLTGLTFALLVGIVALVLSFQNALALNRQADQRNADRIASDLASCQRGNVFRGQVKEGFGAVDQSINGIIDRALANARSENRDALRAEFKAPLEQLANAAQSIKTTDCFAAVPGARGESK